MCAAIAVQAGTKAARQTGKVAAPTRRSPATERMYRAGERCFGGVVAPLKNLLSFSIGQLFDVIFHSIGCYVDLT